MLVGHAVCSLVSFVFLINSRGCDEDEGPRGDKGQPVCRGGSGPVRGLWENSSHGCVRSGLIDCARKLPHSVLPRLNHLTGIGFGSPRVCFLVFFFLLLLSFFFFTF